LGSRHIAIIIIVIVIVIVIVIIIIIIIFISSVRRGAPRATSLAAAAGRQAILTLLPGNEGGGCHHFRWLMWGKSMAKYGTFSS
jgi:uncharacterized alpha/beta hydrolase family protein